MMKSKAMKFILMAIIFVCMMLSPVWGAQSSHNFSSADEIHVRTQNDELFDAYAEKVLFGEKSNQIMGVAASTMLSGADRELYLELADHIEAIAAGTKSQTTIVFDQATIESWGLDVEFSASELGLTSITTQQDVNAVAARFFEQFDVSNVIEALLSDYPYELYWFDKTTGYLRTGSVASHGSYGEVVSCEMYFAVADGYKTAIYNNNAPTVNTEKAVSVQAAASNAQDIVSEHVSNSDAHKIMAYAEEIMDLVSYNQTAAGGGVAYGDPWQIVYVFDGNPATNVVCEGYAKAFKYLCDLSHFTHPDIACYLASGYMDDEAHMWNIVTMHDGKNYLVDVTNSEHMTIGQNGELLLAGGSGSVASGYTFSGASSDVNYVYDQDTKDLWGTGITSILKIANASYELENTTIEFWIDDEIVFDGQDVTAGLCETGNFDICFVTDGDDTNFEYTYSWHEDNGGVMGEELSSAPRNAGTYWICVKAVNVNNALDYVVEEMKFEIKKATPSAEVTVTLIHESGKTLQDANLSVVAKNASGATIEGEFFWVDSSMQIISNTTAVVQGETYKWTFVPSDSSNYLAVSGTKILWHNTYEIAVTSLDEEMGTVTGGGTFEYGESVTVVATPKTGYQFAGWKHGDTIVSENASFTFVVEGNESLVAVFEEAADDGVFDFVDAVDIMWYVLYGLIGLAVICCLYYMTRREREE